MRNIASEYALWHLLDQIPRKAITKQGFKFNLLRLSLELLRTLLCFSTKIFDPTLHGYDLRLLLRDLGLEVIFGVDLGSLVDGGQLLLNTFFHGQFKFTRRGVEFALLAQG